jgi:hypothetical protein
MESLREVDGEEKLISKELLPCKHNQSNASRMLVQYNIKTICLPLPEAHSIVRPIKDIQGAAAGVYITPWECRTIYIPQL